MKVLRTHIGTATKLFGIVIASGMTLALAAPAAATTILINGSFELPDQGGGRTQLVAGTLLGWTYLTGVDSGNYTEITSAIWGFAAADGKQYLDFGGNGTYGGSISQSFATTPGTIYTVAYSTGEQQGDDAAQIMRAIVNNGAQTITADNTALAMGFSAGKAITFTALGNSATLTFFDATPKGAGGPSNVILDAVSVTAQAVVAGVPEPATWAMLMVGFGGVGVAARSRRFKKSVAA